MKTHLNGHQPKELSDAEFEAALHAVLRDEGYLFPRNAEDVASLKAQMDMNGVPTPDTEKFRQLLRQTAAKVVKLPAIVKVSSQEVEANIEKLATAARNGGEITPEIRRRMNADRAGATEQVKKNNGAC
ncbi:MAG: hypothetical protein U1G07_17765 [Verrucomicrobiota bacterium]